MRYKFAGMPHLSRDTLREGPGPFLLLLFGLTAWVVACNPAGADAPSARSDPFQPYAFYLDTWAEDYAQNRLISLDPETLDDMPDGQTLERGIFSDDGSTGVSMEYPEGRGSLNPEDSWIVVYDLESETERSRFHPPAKGLVTDISEDGTRLLLQPDTYPPLRYPPIAEWYVVDTTSGEPLLHIQDADNACFRQRAYLDPAGRRIYCVVNPALAEADKPEPMQIVAYNIESGTKTKELKLPEVLIGASGTELNGQSVEKFLEPAVELSPDGRLLAIVHADADKITLVDAHSLAVEKTFSLRRFVSQWGWFGFTAKVAYAKGEMQGTIRHAAFSPDGRYLYVFSQEVWVRPEDAPAERGLWLVDLERGRVMIEVLPEFQIQWVQPAPDGTAYVFGTTDERLLPFEIRATSPSMLWRLDGLALEILAERAFTGYRHGYLVVGAAAMTSHEATSAIRSLFKLTESSSLSPLA